MWRGATTNHGAVDLRMTAQSADTVAGYRVLRELGRGAMGVVYLVEHPRLGRLEALKVMQEPFASDPSFRTRFLREAATGGSVHHPGLVTVYDQDEVDGLLYMSMQHVPGQDLHRRIERGGPLAVGAAMDLLARVADGLGALHAAGYVHRDVKPSNILVPMGPGGSAEPALLADFGIARALDGSAELTGRAFLGSIPWSAPERFEGDPGSAASDVYAFACVAYEALTGSLPFGRTLPEVLGAHASSSAPRGAADLPPRVLSVLKAGFATRPEDRPSRPADLIAALRSDPDVAGVVAPGPSTNEPSVLTRSTDEPTAEPIPPVTSGGGLGRKVLASRWARVGLAAVVVCVLTGGGITVRELSQEDAGPATTASAVPFRAVALPDDLNARNLVPSGDGAFWMTDADHDRIVRVTLDGGVREYELPAVATYDEDNSTVTTLVAGRDGSAWFARLGQVIGHVTAAGEMTFYPAMSGASVLTPDGEGGVLYTTLEGGLERIDAEGVTSSVPGAAESVGPNASIVDMAVDADGVIWRLDLHVELVRLDPATGVTSTVPLPVETDGAQPDYFSILPLPGGAVWSLGTASLWHASGAGSGEVYPALAWGRRSLYGLISGPDGALYWTDGHRIGRLDPADPQFPTYTVLEPGTRLGGLTFGPGNHLWVADTTHHTLVPIRAEAPRPDAEVTGEDRAEFAALLAESTEPIDRCSDMFDSARTDQVVPFFSCVEDALNAELVALRAVSLPPTSQAHLDHFLQLAPAALQEMREMPLPADESERQEYFIDMAGHLGDPGIALDLVRTDVGLPRTGRPF